VIGIADFARDLRELVERPSPRGVAHPRRAENPFAVGVANRLDEEGVALLRLFGKVFADEKPAEDHPHRPLLGVEGALPPRLLFLLARQDLSREFESSLVERAAQVRRVLRGEMEAQVVAKDGDRRLSKALFQRREKLRLPDDHGFRPSEPERGEARRPVDRWRELRLDVGGRHLVVVAFRVAQVGELPRRAREIRLERQHENAGVGANQAVARRQREELLDVLHVLGSHFHRVLVRVEIEVAVREPEAALPQKDGFDAALLRVLDDREREERVRVERNLGERRVKRSPEVADPSDSVELLLDRSGPGRVTAGGVHRGGPEVADFLAVGTAEGRSGRRILVDFPHSRVDLVADDVAYSPPRLGSGNRIALQPAPVRIAEEIDGGADLRIEIGGENVRPRGRRRRVGRSRDFARRKKTEQGRNGDRRNRVSRHAGKISRGMSRQPFRPLRSGPNPGFLNDLSEE
jgi:hypothetical protein